VLALDRQDIEKLVRRWTQNAIADGQLDLFDELLAHDALDLKPDQICRACGGLVWRPPPATTT
jgi:hypothetical protein